MVKNSIGIALCFLIGVVCRLTSIPLPAPHVIEGALLVMSLTAGVLVANRILKLRQTKELAIEAVLDKSSSNKIKKERA